MANKYRGESVISIDGKLRTLRYTLGALAAFEEAAGFSSIGELAQRLDNLSFSALRKLIWAGLLHEQPDLKLADIGEPDGAVVEWAPVVAAAVMLCLFPAKVAGKETKDPSAKNADGAPVTTSASPTPNDSPSAAASANGISGT